ncbi:MAG: hypothetical protein MSR67_05700 [Oscillospiraceae bacterium]|nr:hypothetical protein [Oscillospiraceae bacterium]
MKLTALPCLADVFDETGEIRLSGEEDLLHCFRDFSEKYGGLFNMSLGIFGAISTNFC